MQYVDWPLLLLFSGLFIVMHGVQKAGLIDRLMSQTGSWLSGDGGSLFSLSSLSVAVSNLVSNVPAVLPGTIWLALKT